LNKVNPWILHLRIQFKEEQEAYKAGREISDLFGCGYRVFTLKGNWDKCESITESIEYKEGSIKIN